MNLGLPVAGVGKVVGALVRGVGTEALVAGGGDEGLEVSRRRLAQKVLELGENLFDRIEIGRVLGEKEQLCAG
jgi:hypothetical protein